MAMVDGGGPVIKYVLVHLLFWGDRWNTDPNLRAQIGPIEAAVDTILAGSYMSGLTQYRGAGTGGERVKPSLIITAPGPGSTYSRSDASDAVWNNIDAHNLPRPEDEFGDMLYFLVAPPGATYDGYPPTWGAHFDASDFDLWTGISDAWVAHVMTDGTLDTFTARFTHELAEAVTDPDGSGFQVAPADDHNWNEVCDVCSGAQRVGGQMLASYWSEKDGRCLVPPERKVQTTWEVSCIRKQPRNDEFHPLRSIGGVNADGSRWEFTQKQAIAMIEDGHTFRVTGKDGSHSTVGVAYHDEPGHGDFPIAYLDTSPDGSKEDNLLSLPECP